MIPNNDFNEQLTFPSFAPSPNNSPPKLLTMQPSEHNVQKITINLP